MSSTFHSEKPRPGTCPSLSPPSEFCPSDFDECKFDWDCETTIKKCCSNGCYRVCAEPADGEDLGKCKACLNLVLRALQAVKPKIVFLPKRHHSEIQHRGVCSKEVAGNMRKRK